MITRKQYKVLSAMFDQAGWNHFGGVNLNVREDSLAKRLIDAIEKQHPGSIRYCWGGKACTRSADALYGYCQFNLTQQALDLIIEHEAIATAGYDGRAREVRSGIEFDFHYRAENMSQLRSAVKRGRQYQSVEIIEANPLTHDQWVQYYGWGRM